MHGHTRTHLQVCTHAFTHTCIRSHTRHIQALTLTYSCTRMHAPTHTHSHACPHSPIRVHSPTCMCPHTYTHAHIYMHVLTFTYTHAHTYMHTHVHTHTPFPDSHHPRPPGARCRQTWSRDRAPLLAHGLSAVRAQEHAAREGQDQAPPTVPPRPFQCELSSCQTPGAPWPAGRGDGPASCPMGGGQARPPARSAV